MSVSTTKKLRLTPICLQNGWLVKAFMNKPHLLLIGYLLSGCATQATLTVNTWPEGAVVSELGTGRFVGESPAVSYYNLNSKSPKNAAGCYLVKGFRAQWQSGAVGATQETITLCGPSTGDYNITVQRPQVGGLDRDQNYAVQKQMLRAQQQQAKSAQDAALLQMYMATKPAPSSTRLPVNCSPTVSGGYSCY